MRAGKDPDLAGDLPKLVGTTSVEPHPLLQDSFAHVRLQEAIHDFGDDLLLLRCFLLGENLGGNRSHGPFLDLFHEHIPLLLARTGTHSRKLRPDERADTLLQRGFGFIDRGNELLLHRVHPCDEPLL